MKKVLTILTFVSVAIISSGQNLVPNGSFEQYSSCPTFYTQFDRVLTWINPAQWPPGGSPDYFNQCAPPQYVGVPSNIFGYQNAYDGNAYVGMILWDMNNLFREYMEAPFAKPLNEGVCYHFEMYACLANKYKYAVDNIGVYFSDTAIAGIPDFLPLPFTPQINNTSGFISDTLNWILISGDYVASGTENFLIIGNFQNDVNTNSLLVNSSAIYDQSYIFIDQVSLTPCLPTSITEEHGNGIINIYPNPVDDEMVVLGSELTGFHELTIYNSIGKLVYEKPISGQQSLTIDMANFSSGIYIIKLTGLTGNVVTKKITRK